MFRQDRSILRDIDWCVSRVRALDLPLRVPERLVEHILSTRTDYIGVERGCRVPYM